MPDSNGQLKCDTCQEKYPAECKIAVVHQESEMEWDNDRLYHWVETYCPMCGHSGKFIYKAGRRFFNMIAEYTSTQALCKTCPLYVKCLTVALSDKFTEDD